jgi:AcrR family transcriptional regulator
LSPTRRRDPLATKAKILRAASQEFARLGFAGARGDRIAKRAGCSERMVYYYYGNKEALFRAVLESAYMTLREAERALQLDELPPLTALDRFCRFVWRYYLDHPEFIGLVNTENLHKGKHLRASGQLNELVSPILGLLERLLQRGAHAAQFRADIDAAELYIAIAAQGYFYLSNQHTLSAVLGRNLRDDAHLQRHWQVSAELIRRFVAVTMPP